VSFILTFGTFDLHWRNFIKVLL